MSNLRCVTMSLASVRSLSAAEKMENSGEHTLTAADMVQIENELPILFAFKRLRREVCFLSSLSHPCIVSILGVLIKPNCPLCFALELAPFGNLADLLSRARRRQFLGRDSTRVLYGSLLDRMLLYKFAWQIAIALQYLHKQGRFWLMCL